MAGVPSAWDRPLSRPTSRPVVPPGLDNTSMTKATIARLVSLEVERLMPEIVAAVRAEIEATTPTEAVVQVERPAYPDWSRSFTQPARANPWADPNPVTCDGHTARERFARDYPGVKPTLVGIEPMDREFTVTCDGMQ
jgi:hypothetical protein